ncbi:MAG: hypothetical protein Q4D76_13925 [Oscillospiraceae bacterium]|nr:hypothetical protein [Oscillospiraceae bacterium]
MKYVASFTDSKGKKITLKDSEKSKTITGFSFKSNSLEDNSIERDRNARCEFTFYGEITPVNNYDLGEIANLSIKSSDVYVQLDVDVINEDDGTKIYRRLSFDKVFFVDYTESFDNNKSSFEIQLAQSPLGKKQDISFDIDDEDE